MEKMKRIRLKKGETISLSTKPDGTNAVKCKIQAYVGEGGSSVCYTATYEGKTGRLKEFYPIDTSHDNTEQYIYLKRSKSKQLIPVGAGMTERFKAMRNDFIGAYQTLEKAKTDNPKNEVLNNYIPAYILLYGCDETGTASVYVWTPDDKQGKGFNEYLAKVRKYPKKLPVQNLYNIISTIHTLTDCIKALHSAGLLHLDIKPSNFLVPYNSKTEINTSNISLFDINTIYPIASSFTKISGTDGFRAPEVDIGKAENRSDIYSIGAMLFYGIIICDTVHDGLYREEHYSHIDHLVSDSALINAADSNSNVFLRSMLSGILKKCLAKRVRDRYACCEELIDDLKSAKTILLPNIASDNLAHANKKLALIDTEEQKETNPTAIIQNLLYKNPIMDWLPKDSLSINVLVFGAGTYAQKFIDTCLQAGQIRGYKLNITAVSNNHEYDKKVYLQFRPAANQFININGSMKNSKDDVYANLDFVPASKEGMSLTRKNTAENRHIVDDIMLDATDNPYRYIFIALGDDGLNHQVAKACVDAAKALEINCSVNFVLQSGEKKKYKKGNPVYISESISAGSIDTQLERMALNIHLSWANSLNVDMQKTKQDFREKYNYESSMAYALSIKYKLRCLGITEPDLKKAAELFSKAISDKTVLKDMVACERRRWVVEKIVDGWSAPRDSSGRIDYEGCVRRGSVKDKPRKLHPCIVHSKGDTPLSGHLYRENNRAKWNDGEIDPSLDELDKVSLGLYRCFKKHAEKLRAQYSLHSGDMDIIRHKIADAPEPVIIGYNRFMLCLKNILNGSPSYSKQYGHYEKIFVQSLALIPEKLSKDIIARLKHVKDAFFCAIESNMYRDYKSYDEVLVRKTPFILTHTPQQYIAMAFDDGRMDNGRNDVIFSNVASATVLNPGKLNYLYYFDGTAKVPFFIQKVRSALYYLDSRKIQSQVYFSIAMLKTIPATDKAELLLQLKNLKQQTRLNSYSITECEDEDTAIKILLESLKSKKIHMFDGTTQLFTTRLKCALFSHHAYQQFPYFEFDTGNKSFVNCKDTQHLKYIEDKSFIKADDMFALRNAKDDKFYFPEFSTDYEILWGIYSGNYKKGGNATTYGYNVLNWNRMCNYLEGYSSDHDKVVEFRLSPDKKCSEQHMLFYFPDYGFKAASLILNKLIEYGVILEGSAVTRYTSDTCRADIITNWNISEDINRIFSRMHHMVDCRFLKVERTYIVNNPQISIHYDNLAVTDLSLTDDKYTIPILEKLSKANFINNFRRGKNNNQVVSFVYSSQRIKKLLTTAGEILEIYTYYEALKTGYFDDVVCGYEFKWEHGNVKNEIDCILTKGFRSLMIECKGRKQLEPGYYHKLQTMSDQFGIGYKKVLIANTYMQSEYLDDINHMRRAMGDQMGIITVSKPDDILNIGHTLIKIMNDTLGV
ncbi:MAG: hypothetical protein FWC77_02725 [Defluviitaleaceae bacterium]|nr:hypothetical protein [Defluviitaleaceae bacterium]